jgi:hypothetical protein
MPNLIAEFIKAVTVDALAQCLGELLIWFVRKATEAAKQKRPDRCDGYQPKHLKER